jgi:uncharacterized cupin superfamily protein
MSFKIVKESKPSPERLNAVGVYQWPIWTKEPSTFPWTYDSEETCYFIEGDVTVTPDGGAPVHMGVGDLVIFPAGMTCIWEIHQAVRKYYRFA